ncbi:hypothetical protein [Methylocapsa acidiphila]|uniref:hypothetical protein n=1 Tax=Methylocapsa acidiphila TaxID=133552 RepID=UPI000425F565|nr:hypothetical protein [Methylocapsa acidiphila]
MICGVVCADEYGAVGDGVTDDSNALLAALATGNSMALSTGKTYLVSKSLILNQAYYTGQPGKPQHLYGHGATLKRAAQFSTTFTTTITAGVTKQITVADASGFEVGQSICILNGSTYDNVTGNNVITEISGNLITFASTFGISASGTTSAYLSFYLLQLFDGCTVRDLEIDGNASNYTFNRWEVTIDIYSRGYNNVVQTCFIHDSPGDAIQEGQTELASSNPVDSGNRYIHNKICNINGNGIHFSGSISPLVEGNHIENTNLQGAVVGHSGGNICFSAFIRDARIINNYLGAGVSGVGLFQTANSIGTLIRGNIIRNSTTSAFLALGGSAPNAVFGVMIKENFIYDCSNMNLTWTNSPLSLYSGSGNTTSGSHYISSFSMPAGLSLTTLIGLSISGSGIPAGSITIGANLAGTQITIGDRGFRPVNATATASGVSLTLAGTYPTNIMIDGNYIFNTPCQINSAYNLNITNNIFDLHVSNAANALAFGGIGSSTDTSLSNVVIAGNQFTNGSVGINFGPLGAINPPYVNNIAIRSNLFYNQTSRCVYMDAIINGGVVDVIDNILNPAVGSGIYAMSLSTANARVQDNHVSMTGGTAGIALFDSAMFVEGNKIDVGTSTYSIIIESGTSNNVVVNNKLSMALTNNGSGSTTTPNY